MKVKKFGPGFVYLMHAGGTKLYKIGQSADQNRRLLKLNYDYPMGISLIHVIPVTNMKESESYLHRVFRDKRVKGEWFELNEFEISTINLLYDDSITELSIQLVIEQEYFQKLIAMNRSTQKR